MTHEILTGRPRHHADGPLATLAAAERLIDMVLSDSSTLLVNEKDGERALAS